MNKKLPLILLSVFALSSCAKTKLLYKENAYNSPIFDENYYTEWEGIDQLQVSQDLNGFYGAYESNDYTEQGAGNVKIAGDPNHLTDYTWNGDDENQFGYHYCLSDIEKKFNYGITSKLFDGRVRCDGYYQKSRVQIDKSGFAMYFPKTLVNAKFLGFACRGGTNLPDTRFGRPDLKVNFEWSFYIHVAEKTYNRVTYRLNNIEIPVDNGGNTTFVSFLPYMGADFTELNSAVAMSFKWECAEVEEMSKPEYNLTDDYTDKEKNHLSLMLYEMFIGESSWN